MSRKAALADFVHLRVHSAYSLAEGAIPVKQLPDLCSELGMPAVAVTDTNNLFGALEFSAAAAKAGVQPIIGCQLTIRFKDAKDSAGVRAAKGADTGTMVFLVKDDAGYRNLLKLISHAYLKGDDAEDPEIPLDVLAAHGDGLIALTGGADGPVGRELQDGQNDAAEILLKQFAEIFPERLYIEIQRHGLPAEATTEPALLDLAYRHELPLVATNEAFFAEPDMYEAHDALICIAEGAYVSQTERRKLTRDHYFKSAREMRKLFADLPEALDNTLVVAKRCAFMVESIAPILPPFDCGVGRDEETELRAQAAAGLELRLTDHVLKPEMSDQERETASEPYRRRLDYELGVIVEMGFPGYFLIVADFIQWAKNHDIPVGPGRGSGAGSVAAWALQITDLDPLRWGLLFERFLTPERVSMPDFDIDFCQDRRDEVITYVQQKYGADHVAQIITFGKLQARAVLRDVGRVLEMPYGQVDKISKLVPNNPANPVTLSEAIIAEPRMREMINEDPAVKRLVNLAKRLEGLYRHASTHAAGVVIGDRPLDELIPLYRDPRSTMPVTGFNMKYVESAGLVKFDFLGLKTLTVLAVAERLVRDNGIALDIAKLPLDDASTYEMIATGDTTGVFQLESAGMRDVLRGMRPDTFEDIIAVVALYRPGPMENIPSYVRRKHGEEEPDYMYPTLEPILKETFGIMIYQEQVMQVAQELSGFSLGGADLLRRAMGKKIQSEMDEQRQVFIDGAKAKSVDESKASEIFDQVNTFAGYGFNKSHAAAYALIAYQTAYMKANHPVEFLAASMTLDISNTDKLTVFIRELRNQNIPLLPPDVNESTETFSVARREGEPAAIRFGMAAIKNVGAAAMKTIVDERQANGRFTDLADFVGRLDAHAVNKRQLENLVRAGGFDSLEPNRRAVFESVESLVRQASAAQSDRESNQIGLFAGDSTPTVTVSLPDIADWSGMERLAEEFGALGFYLSAHPLDAYARRLRKMDVLPSAGVIAAGKSGSVRLAGTLIAKKERISAKGNRFAFIQFSDSSGDFEVTVFSEALSAAGDWLVPGNSLLIRCAAQADEHDGVKFLANSFEPLEQAAANETENLCIVVDDDRALAPIQDILANEKAGKGRIRIVSRLTNMGQDVECELAERFAVSPEVYLAVRSLPGVLDVRDF